MPRKAQKNPPDLSPLELEIMSIVWELGECTSADVITAFRRRRPLADTTIRTVLANIRRKGYIDVVPSVEAKHRFRPRVTRESVARRSLRQMVSNLFGGSPEAAIAFMLREESIDAAELESIRALIADTENPKETS